MKPLCKLAIKMLTLNYNTHISNKVWSTDHSLNSSAPGLTGFLRNGSFPLKLSQYYSHFLPKFYLFFTAQPQAHTVLNYVYPVVLNWK